MATNPCVRAGIKTSVGESVKRTDTIRRVVPA